MTITEFIRKVLITEIGDIVDRHKYLSFGVVSQGIELLGACLDENEFDCRKQGVSPERFNLALKELFPEKKYDQFGPNPDSDVSLYKDLRCGFLHNVLPKKAFSLTEIKNTPPFFHLSEGTDREECRRYLLIAEEYYRDFVIACWNLIHLIKSQELQKRAEFVKLKNRILDLSQQNQRTGKEEDEFQAKGRKYAILTEKYDFLSTDVEIKIMR